MNKDKLQVGDLVFVHMNHSLGAGLLVKIEKHAKAWPQSQWPYKVYWFKSGYVGSHSRKSINKLEIPNE
tara:strand:+ start:376 stop:582 length:207 start_codon:yes stop_codon:yes gene_type:complete